MKLAELHEGRSWDEGWNVTIDGVKYVYDPEDMEEDDNVKIWHKLYKVENGKKIDIKPGIDWSPYSKLSQKDLELWLKCGMPTRKDCGTNGPIRAEDLKKFLAANKQVSEARATPGTKKYPSTEEGIKAFMKGEMDKGYAKKLDIETCEFIRDPHNEGVWGIDSMATGERVIVYLGGFKDADGYPRPFDDFEGGRIPVGELRKYLQLDKITQDQFDKFRKAK